MIRNNSMPEPGPLMIDGTCFRDRSGRHVILRGVNLGGDCKVPFTPNGHTHCPTDFRDHRNVCFIGRPAPLDEIDQHLARIRHWGFNCLRLLTTWEAVEHAGPGQHDLAYLDYFAEVCRRAGKYGLHVFVDFHQDVWSRMSGGDGAPGWTFEVAGLDFNRFHASGAAHVMQNAYDAIVGGRQASYPVMSWGGNYRRPANGIMWTLFFAGSAFASDMVVDGRNIEAYLQGHYLGSMRALAEKIAHIENVIGFDTLNEPGTGYIGALMEAPLSKFYGEAWTPLDGLSVASGCSREIEILALGGQSTGRRLTANASGVSIWLPGREDPFRAGGAWDIDSNGSPVVLDPGYFRTVNGARVETEQDFMVPFFNRVAQTVRSVREDWLIFAEVDPFAAMRGGRFPAGCPERTVNASHWYDLGTLVTKRFDPDETIDILTGKPLSGPTEIEQAYVDGLTRIRQIGDALNDGAPTLIGEFGIPFDMNDAAAYARWTSGERGEKVWDRQTVALALMYNAIDQLLLSSTQWNYTVSNRNDPMIGDGWNQEDLSIWSIDQGDDAENLDEGGRAVTGFCRAYVQAAQGTLVFQRYDAADGRFQAVIATGASAEPTVVFYPRFDIDRHNVDAQGAEFTHSGSYLCFTALTEVRRLSINIEPQVGISK